MLGGDTSPVPSPERMRNEYLVGFLLIDAPLIFLSIAPDLWLGFDAFTWTRLALGLLSLLAFILIRLGKLDLAIDGLFFGCVLILSTGYYFSLPNPNLAEDLFLLVCLANYGSVALYGLYARSNRRLWYLFLITTLIQVFNNSVLLGASLIRTQLTLGLLIFQVFSYCLARFLRYYFRRITEIAEARRKMNRSLETLVAEARSAGNERLESFSHDIRSPITGILGVHDLLASTKLDAEQASYLRILEKSNRLLLEIVESILAPDSGPVALSGGRNSMQELLDDILTPYETSAHLKGVLIKRRVIGNPPPLPLSRAEAARVVGNLVDNALKYTEEGIVYVTVRTPVDFPGTDLTVVDNGAGMSPERLEEVRSGTPGAEEGVSDSHGLGLCGVRRLIEDAGGVMLVDSEQGKGTKVTLRFPHPEG